MERAPREATPWRASNAATLWRGNRITRNRPPLRPPLLPLRNLLQCARCRIGPPVTRHLPSGWLEGTPEGGTRTSLPLPSEGGPGMGGGGSRPPAGSAWWLTTEATSGVVGAPPGPGRKPCNQDKDCGECIQDRGRGGHSHLCLGLKTLQRRYGPKPVMEWADGHPHRAGSTGHGGVAPTEPSHRRIAHTTSEAS